MTFRFTSQNLQTYKLVLQRKEKIFSHFGQQNFSDMLKFIKNVFLNGFTLYCQSNDLKIIWTNSQHYILEVDVYPENIQTSVTSSRGNFHVATLSQ